MALGGHVARLRCYNASVRQGLSFLHDDIRAKCHPPRGREMRWTGGDTHTCLRLESTLEEATSLGGNMPLLGFFFFLSGSFPGL